MTDVLHLATDLYLATDDAAISVALVAIVVAVPLLLLAGLVFVAYTKWKAKQSGARRHRSR